MCAREINVNETENHTPVTMQHSEHVQIDDYGEKSNGFSFTLQSLLNQRKCINTHKPQTRREQMKKRKHTQNKRIWRRFERDDV